MVKIVTDSAADIPVRLQAELQIPVVPARILFGRECYTPGIDLDSDDFYNLLQSKYFHPQSTQGSPLDFYRIFKSMKHLKEDIIYLGLTKDLSAFSLSAELAIERLPDVSITIFESGGPSGFQGILVVQAARMAAAGFSREEILKQLDYLHPLTFQYAAAETLDYLIRGGRVSASSGTLGKLLGINPLLRIAANGVEAGEREFGMEAAMEEIISSLKSDFTPEQPVIALINHAVNPLGSVTLSELVKQNFNVKEMHTSQIGATIGSHIGPGAVGATLSPALPFLM